MAAGVANWQPSVQRPHSPACLRKTSTAVSCQSLTWNRSTDFANPPFRRPGGVQSPGRRTCGRLDNKLPSKGSRSFFGKWMDTLWDAHETMAWRVVHSPFPTPGWSSQSRLTLSRSRRMTGISDAARIRPDFFSATSLIRSAHNPTRKRAFKACTFLRRPGSYSGIAIVRSM